MQALISQHVDAVDLLGRVRMRERPVRSGGSCFREVERQQIVDVCIGEELSTAKTGTNAGAEEDGTVPASLAALIHFLKRFALTPLSSARRDTETPGSRQDPTRRTFHAGSYQRHPSRPTYLTFSF